MRRLALILAVHALPALAGPPGLPADRLIEWRAGVQRGIPSVKARAKLAAAQLRDDAAGAIQGAINSLGQGGAILLPAGEFTLRAPLRLRSGVVLRGKGPSKTRLILDTPPKSQANDIDLAGGLAAPVEVLEGATAGSRRLRLRSAKGLEPGSDVVLFSENDPARMYTRKAWDAGWAKQSPGQIVRVTKVAGDWVALDVPVRLTHTAALKPRIRALTPIRRAGLEDLYLERRRQKAESSIISIRYAIDCWVRNVEGSHTLRGHVWIECSRFCTVESCTFHHAHDYGGGGHGYGVVAGKHATDCLIWNNRFRKLRHAMMTKQGANGNVFAYNLSEENVDKCDISIHGHLSYMNLFEGNDVQFVQVADYWGPTGPLTTFFRNRVATRLDVKDHSHRTTVVANLLRALNVAADCKDVLADGNVIDGKPRWLTRPRRLTASLFLDKKPPFWDRRPWPPFGPERKAIGPALPASKLGR